MITSSFALTLMSLNLIICGEILPTENIDHKALVFNAGVVNGNGLSDENKALHQLMVICKNSLSRIIDQRITQEPSAPWYSTCLTEAIDKHRKAERTRVSSRLTMD